MGAKKGVLLLNLGTPDSPETKDVRKYLREFLMDGRVLDINAIGRWILVNLIIAPFRGPKSAKEYKELWTDKGSPLMYHGTELTELVQKSLGDDYEVSFGMRYQNPSIKKSLEVFRNKGIDKLLVVPM
ncbi:MAG: ferrochelatase, partial [Cyclobacteriaceae bacterium]